MKEKGKLTQIYQLDVHFPLFQCEEQILPIKNVNFDNLKDMEYIFNCILDYVTDDIKKAFYYN